MIYWFTGQPGHGKTTLAKALIAHLQSQGSEAFHVDGDDLRALTSNANYSRKGREANIRRAQTIAHYLHNQNKVVVVSLVAPYRDLREEFKAATNLTEIYVHTTESRGREDKYAIDYEAPLKRFIDIDTTKNSAAQSLDILLKQL
jgi:adenylylsulfate kinase|tara:strand:- start:95 stop:529 length:435 start_codon:yes stop_codon:yes gene_type:complete